MRNAFIYRLLLILLFPHIGEAADLVGVASVIDGDTLEIHGQRIRLHGVDAPESPQYCYLAGGKKWRCGQTAALQQDVCGASAAGENRPGRDMEKPVSEALGMAEAEAKEPAKIPPSGTLEDAVKKIWRAL